MNDLSSKFSLYEMLRILIPGILIATNIGIANDILHYELPLRITNNYYNGIVFFMGAFISGLFLYSLDLPKQFRFFQKDLPTRKIKEKHPTIADVKIVNSRPSKSRFEFGQ